MKKIFTFVLTLLVFLLIGVLGIALLIAWSLGLGWVLWQLVPVLSLFEAGLLVMLATCALLYAASRLALPLPESAAETYNDAWEEEYPLPLLRFLEEGTAVTQETIFRHQLANAIYMNLLTNPDSPQMMNNTQLEALAMRLVEVMVAILKRKPQNTPRVSVSIAAMKKEMDKMGQRPYDDDILQIAVGAANVEFAFDDELADIVREKRWSEAYDDD